MEEDDDDDAAMEFSAPHRSLLSLLERVGRGNSPRVWGKRERSSIFPTGVRKEPTGFSTA